MEKNNEKNSPLLADEITVGIADINPVNGTFEMYLRVDPRIVMDKLDEKFGPLGWKKESSIEEINGRPVMKCTIIAKDGAGNWISRDDHSSGAAWAEDQEAKVMEADALRRAAVQFDIGRELYTFKNIVASLTNDKGDKVLNYFSIKNGENDLYRSSDELYVEQIVYDEKYHIVALSIKNASLGGVRVYLDDRRNSAVQSTVINGENNLAPLDDAKKVLADVGHLAGKELGELTGEQLALVWEKTKNPEVKTAALRVAQKNPEAKQILTRMGVKI